MYTWAVSHCAAALGWKKSSPLDFPKKVVPDWTDRKESEPRFDGARSWAGRVPRHSERDRAQPITQKNFFFFSGKKSEGLLTVL